MQTDKTTNTQKIVLLALLTAIVVLLQFLGAFIRFGPFSVSLVLMPIVIGAALAGIAAGTWLGLVFGAVVLATGDANLFIAINPAGAIITVLVKGTLAGFSAGVVYKALAKSSQSIGALCAAVVCPLVNTGVFVICSYVFFLDALTEWGIAAGFISVTAYIFLGMISFNFLFELGLNIVLCPAIIRLIQYGQKTIKSR